MAGGSASRTYFGTGPAGLKSETTIGVQTRSSIHAGLFNTKDRVILSTVRDDQVEEFSIGVFAEHTLRLTPWFRTIVGLRADIFNADVASNLAANSGHDLDTIMSPKLSLVFGPGPRRSFISTPAPAFTATMRAARSRPWIRPRRRRCRPARRWCARKAPRWDCARSPPRTPPARSPCWCSSFDSEIVFVGDAGTTEANRPSRRIGAEYTLRSKLRPWLWLDLDAAYSRARFLEDDPAAPGRYIPGATEGVVSAALNFDNVGGWFGGVRVRYFGPRPLIEDNSVRSKSSTPVSARLGYKFADGLIVRVDGFNLFDQKSHQIDYYYASRLTAEPAAVDDIHFHPLEPRSFRLSVRKEF